MDKYEDIINLKYNKSNNHAHMSLQARASQFAPFSALTGFEELIKETSRITSEKIEIDDTLKLVLNDKLKTIKDNIKNSVEASFTYFIKDNRKSGGRYITVTDKVKKIDLYNKKIITYKKTEIPIEEIIDISDIKFKIS